MSFKHEQFEQACFDQTVQKLEREQASLMVKVEVGKGDVVSRTVYEGCANVLPGHKGSSPVTGLEWSRGFQEVKVPKFHDNGTGWWSHQPPLPPENTPGTHSC